MSNYSSTAIEASSPDSLSNIFEPDVLLPSQFNAPDQEGLDGGERKLMAALLSDGIESYIHQATAPTPHRTEVFDWIETKDHSYVFSFDIVCECLGIDPDYLRLGLSRYVSAVRIQRSSGSGSVSWKKIRRPRK